MTTTTDFKCAVRADLFARAMLGISTEQTRYYLNGVYVSAAPEGGALLVATDGHWLIAIRDPRGVVEGSGIVALNDSMRKALTKHRTDYGRSVHGRGAERVLIVGSGETVKDARAMIVLGGPVETPKDADPVDPRADTLTNLDVPGRDVMQAQFYDVLIDGTFPDFHRVIPSDADFTLRPPLIDNRLIEKASRALADGVTKSRAVTLGPSKGNPGAGPVIVLPAYKQTSDHTAIAVVMPMRNDNPTPTVPAFWKKAE